MLLPKRHPAAAAEIVPCCGWACTVHWWVVGWTMPACLPQDAATLNKYREGPARDVVVTGARLCRARGWGIHGPVPPLQSRKSGFLGPRVLLVACGPAPSSPQPSALACRGHARCSSRACRCAVAHAWGEDGCVLGAVGRVWVLSCGCCRARASPCRVRAPCVCVPRAVGFVSGAVGFVSVDLGCVSGAAGYLAGACPTPGQYLRNQALEDARRL